MLFNSLAYLLFLPIVVGLHWMLDKRFRPLLLLAASYYFYMSWFAKYGILLAFLTLANYLIGLVLNANRFDKEIRRTAFLAGIGINLGCLIFFKYTNFLLDSFWRLATVGLHLSNHAYGTLLSAPHMRILLPLGISFFVFEFIHYLSDIYQGSRPIKNPVHFALFAAFFPSQIAGPIKRYQDFEEQVVEAKPFERDLFFSGCWLILEGMLKKVVLGDNLALIVQRGFDQPQSLIAPDAWICTLAFALQIYYDFAGYTDIGRGSAMLFGFRLPENFNQPYLASSIIDFWHRWHISLSTWLRDYLYKPLGGSKNGLLQKNKNLLITMLLGGLWHGASWHYVLWGAFHGVGLVCNHWWRQVQSKGISQPTAARTLALTFVGTLTTFFFVLLGWVLFRAASLSEALAMYGAMFNFSSNSLAEGPCLSMLITSALPAGFFLYICFQMAKRLAKNYKTQREAVVTSLPYHSWRYWLTPVPSTQAIGYVSLALLILAFAARKPNPFIYFQF
jgi:alginate O-acetyltransferase complex protein AlgI